ncbi:MAG TPA: hypothetical protein VK867_09645 [Candidatus Limnocylindrales bacterium]|nr:hypothetical protein [Candidatus Limnocylindrales bacterium]
MAAAQTAALAIDGLDHRTVDITARSESLEVIVLRTGSPTIAAA